MKKTLITLIALSFGVQSFAEPTPVLTEKEAGATVGSPPVRGVIHVRRERIHPALVPPAVTMSTKPHQGPYSPGQPIGPPIQKMEVVEGGRKIIDPAPTARVALPGEAPTLDHAVPQAKRVIELPSLVSTLANLSPDVELFQQSVFWTGAAILTAQLVKAGMMAYTRNPQVAAFIPPITISSAPGVYKVPGHVKYTLGDARYVAAMMADLSPAAAEDYADSLDPELVEYMLQVNAAVRMGIAEDYVRQCPNPDMCV